MRKKKILESKLESDAIKWARDELGLLSRKMNGLGFNSWPDRLFTPARKKAHAKRRTPMPLLWIEFKREGKEPTEAQAELHAELRERGQEVHVCDKLGEFKLVATDYVRSLT